MISFRTVFLFRVNQRISIFFTIGFTKILRINLASGNILSNQSIAYHLQTQHLAFPRHQFSDSATQIEGNVFDTFIQWDRNRAHFRLICAASNVDT